MEHWDNKSEQQVWDRVFAPPETKRESLRPLILAAQEQAAAYRQLMTTLTGPAREGARELYQENWQTVMALVGLERLSGSSAEALKPGPQPKEPARRLLEKSYHRAKKAMTEYTARSLDGEFGVVFQHLAQQEGLHCVRISRLLGML